MNAEEKAALEFFLRKSVETARTMPMDQSVKFLHGLIVAIPDAAPYAAEIQAGFRSLCVATDKFNDIASGQLALVLEEAA